MTTSPQHGAEPANGTSQAAHWHAQLVDALRSPAAYPDLCADVELIETHISSVLLAGAYAYKLKKPVHYGFVDFSTLEKRKRFCLEELRLNRRTAPQLYLDVVPVTGTLERPRIGGDGPVLEYAVRMQRFGSEQLLDRMAKAGTLDPALIDAFAEQVAHFHAAIPKVAPDAVEGTTGEIWRWAHENFTELRRHRLFATDRVRLESLEDWTRREFEARRVAFVTRRLQGSVRECHGDLHLGNVVVLDGRPVAFDGIEFNPALSGIDVINEIAFPFADLFDHGLPRLAWRFLNRYLEVTGDYAGLAVLRFYAVYRAMVRAKVARLRADGPHEHGDTRPVEDAEYHRQVALAQALSVVPRPVVVVMTGLPASGKSTVAEHLAEEIGAVRIRSDVERKRLYGVPSREHPVTAYEGGLYGAEATRRTYERLATLAFDVVAAGYPVVVDASFSRRDERAAFLDLAGRLDAAFFIVECTAPVETLRERITRRSGAGSDVSDATLPVLERRLSETEPLGPEEQCFAWHVATDADPTAVAERCADLAQRWDFLARRGSGAPD